MNRNRERAMAWASWVRRVRAQGCRVKRASWRYGDGVRNGWDAYSAFGVLSGWYSPGVGRAP